MIRISLRKCLLVDKVVTLINFVIEIMILFSKMQQNIMFGSLLIIVFVMVVYNEFTTTMVN